MSSITVKSLHPIAHVAHVTMGSKIVRVLFQDATPQSVSEEVGKLLAEKKDNEGKFMYEVSGLKKDFKAPKPFTPPMEDNPK